VDAADAVLVARQREREKRHVELTAPAAAAEREECVRRESESARVLAAVAHHEVGCERVMAGGNRRVGGEYRGCRNCFAGRGERDATVGELTHQLDAEERGVAFVHVPGGRRDPERAQRAHAADAEDHLLLDAGVVVPAVELVGDRAVRLRVLREVGVEQDHLDPPDCGAPYLYAHVAGREPHADDDRLARRIECRPHGQVVRTDVAVLGYLVAVGVDGLREIALAVEEPDGDE
jgi:hypothetical protein